MTDLTGHLVATVCVGAAFLIGSLLLNLIVGRWAAKQLRKLDEENAEAMRESRSWHSR